MNTTDALLAFDNEDPIPWHQNGTYGIGDGYIIRFENNKRLMFKEGRLHREDGPALIQYCVREWYLCGTFVSQELHDKVVKGPVDELPLYLGRGFDAYIAERLANGLA